MKQFAAFLKTTLIGGLLVLLPVLLLSLVLSQVFDLLIALATPIADLFPKGFFDDAEFPALLSIILFCGGLLFDRVKHAIRDHETIRPMARS